MIFFQLDEKKRAHARSQRAIRPTFLYSSLLLILLLVYASTREVAPPPPQVSDKTLAEDFRHQAAVEIINYHFRTARELLDKASRLEPGSLENRIAAGKFFYVTQEYTRAVEELAAAAKIDGSRADVLLYAAKLKRVLLAGRAPASRETELLFAKAYLLDSSLDEAFVEWLSERSFNGDMNGALSEVKKRLEKTPEDPNLFWATGKIYAAAGKTADAINYFHRALDRDNRHCKVRVALGDALLAGGDWEHAAAEFTLASELSGLCREALYKAAGVRMGAKDYVGAEKVLQELISLSPDFPNAYRSLASLAEARGDESSAINWLEAEVNHNPKNFRAQVELSDKYSALGRWKDAIPALESVTSHPFGAMPQYAAEHLKAYLLLSRLYRRSGKFGEAEAVLMRARQVIPDHPEVKREEDKIAHRQASID